MSSCYTNEGTEALKVQGTYLESQIPEVVELGSNISLSDCKVHVCFKITSFIQPNS